jgi:hypothetical protein
MSKLNLQAKPYETYGYTEGSNSPMTSALAYTKNMNEKQSNLNTVGGKRSVHRKRNMKGGDNGSVTVPQFPQIGPNLSPINSNTSSIQTNTTSIATKNNAVNDCYAFGNCPTVGGRRKYKRSQHKRSQHKRITRKHKRSTRKRSTRKRTRSNRK